MRVLIKYLFISVVGVFLLNGCGTDTLEPDISRLGFTYFPLEKGLFRIYDVEDITFSVLGNDTSYYQLKEQVVDSFLNQNQAFTYILHRSTRINNSQSWSIDSVWTTRRTSWQAIKVENNVPFIKLSFPVKLDSVWDGNALNGKEKDEYIITELFVNQSINGQDLPTIRVSQEEQDDIITRNIRNEVYGEDIGLIEKTNIAIEFCNETDCFGQKIIERGKSVKLTLNEYGKE